MIGRICGTLIEKEPPRLLIDAGGVGYVIDAPMNTFYQLPAVNEQVVLHVHTVVREDAFLLFGFFTRGERDLFCKLIAVNGVGPRLALAVLSGMAAAELVEAIANEQVDLLTRIPGIGRKTAERMVLDLKDKMDDLSQFPSSMRPEGAASGSIVEEAVAALQALGYKRGEAERLVKKVDGQMADSEALIRAALQGAMRS